MRTHHFLHETSQFDFLRHKNTIFSKFRPCCDWDFTFNSQNLKPNFREMHFLGFKNTIFSKFRPRCVRDFTFSASFRKYLSVPMAKLEAFFANHTYFLSFTIVFGILKNLYSNHPTATIPTRPVRKIVPKGVVLVFC